MNWIEWKGECVGDIHHTVCLCIYTYVDDGPPVIGIIPRAFCWRGEWEFSEGDTSIYHTLSDVPRKSRKGATEYEYINIYQPERGDKVYYSVPTLPDGNPFDLNDVKKHLYKGLAVVQTKSNLVNCL